MADSAEYPYRHYCQYFMCYASFSSEEALRVHIAAGHGGNPLVCADCGKKCSNRSNFERHRRHCTGGPRHDHECPFSDCERSFCSRRTLGIHLAMDHAGKLEKAVQFYEALQTNMRAATQAETENKATKGE